MRSVDLFGCEVRDVDGHPIGTVHDARLEAGDRTTADAGSPAYSIVSLEVGPAGLGHRLGYDRGETAGPWPLTAIFRRLARRSINVPWSAVDSIAETTVTLRVSESELRTEQRR